MPFVPFSMFANLTHLGLPGDDLTDVSAAFFYTMATPILRANIAKLLGSGPSRSAQRFLGGGAALAQTKVA